MTTGTALRLLLTFGICGAGVTFNLWFAVQNRATWSVDFNQFYAAGDLAGTGQLYDWGRLQELQLRHHSTVVPTGRLPIFAFCLKPLTFLSYQTARIVWLVTCTGAVLLFVRLWPACSKLLLIIALCWSLPLTMSVAFGQDVPLFACAFAAAVACLRKGRSFAAGGLFSLCAVKFHLASGIVVLVLGRRDWRAVAAGIAGLAALLGASFAIEGPDWLSRWLEMSRMPEFDPAAARMPNLRGLASWFPAPHAVQWALTIAVLSGSFIVVRRYSLAVSASVALAAGFVAGHHAYVYDALLLLPLAVLAADQWRRRVVLVIWSLLLITPIPYVLLLTEAPFLGQLAISGFVVVVIGCLIRDSFLKSDGLLGEAASGLPQSKMRSGYSDPSVVPGSMPVPRRPPPAQLLSGIQSEINVAEKRVQK